MKKTQLKSYLPLFLVYMLIAIIILIPQIFSQEETPQPTIISQDSKHLTVQNPDGSYTATLYAYYEPDMADFAVTRDGAIINASYKGRYLALEAIPMRNNTEYTWQQVKQAYPNVNFSYVLHQITDRQKYDLNFTNIPSGSQLQLKRVGTNINPDTVQIFNESHIEIGDFVFEFNKHCHADINLSRIILNNLSAECLDPVILLTAGNITHDGTAIRSSSSYSIDDTSSVISLGTSFPTPDETERGFIVFNISRIPDTATISQVNLSVFLTQNSVDTVTIMNITTDASFFNAKFLYNTLGVIVSAPEANAMGYNSGLDWSASGWKNLTLGGNANTDLQNALTKDNFSIGFNTTELTSADKIQFASSRAVNTNQRPVLIVTYAIPSDYPSYWNVSYGPPTGLIGNRSYFNVSWSDDINLDVVKFGHTFEPTIIEEESQFTGAFTIASAKNYYRAETFKFDNSGFITNITFIAREWSAGKQDVYILLTETGALGSPNISKVQRNYTIKKEDIDSSLLPRTVNLTTPYFYTANTLMAIIFTSPASANTNSYQIYYTTINVYPNGNLWNSANNGNGWVSSSTYDARFSISLSNYTEISSKKTFSWKNDTIDLILDDNHYVYNANKTMTFLLPIVGWYQCGIDTSAQTNCTPSYTYYIATDMTPPTVLWKNPLNRTAINGNLTFKVDATDSSEIKRVDFLFKNSSTSQWFNISDYGCTNANKDSSNYYICNFNSTKYFNEWWNFSVQVWDNADNLNNGTLITLNIDRDIPILQNPYVKYPDGQCYTILAEPPITKCFVSNNQSLIFNITAIDTDAGIAYVRANVSLLDSSTDWTNMSLVNGSSAANYLGYYSLNLTTKNIDVAGIKDIGFNSNDTATPVRNNNGTVITVNVDTNSPRYSGCIIQTSPPYYQNTTITFQCLWTENSATESGLIYYKFEHNVTNATIGKINESQQTFSDKWSSSSTYNLRLNYSANFSARFYAWDIANNTKNYSNYLTFEVKESPIQVPNVQLNSTYDNAVFRNISIMRFGYNISQTANLKEAKLILNGFYNVTNTSINVANTFQNFSLERIQDGTHNWDVEVCNTDDVCNTSGQSWEFSIWSIPTVPDIILPINGNSYTDTGIQFASEDFHGDVITYKIYINNTLNITTTENITDWNASIGYYNLTITAGDDTNTSFNSSIIQFTITEPDTSPTWSLNQTTEDFIYNRTVQLNITLADATTLTSYIFSWNSSGTWTNSSNITISGISWIVSENKTLTNTTPLSTIGWLFYFYDNGSNIANSSTFTKQLLNLYPSWSANKTTEDLVYNRSVHFNISLADEHNLSSYIFSWNGSGEWYNYSNASITEKTWSIWINKSLGNLTPLGTVSWTFYFNDSVNQRNQTAIFTKQLLSLYPWFSGNETNVTGVTGEVNVTFNITTSDEFNLSYWIFSWNGTGDNWDNLTNGSLSGTSVKVIANKSINLTSGTIGYRWYANDSSGNWNNSELRTFIVTATEIQSPSDSGGGGGIPFMKIFCNVTFSPSELVFDNFNIREKLYITNNNNFNISILINITNSTNKETDDFEVTPSMFNITINSTKLTEFEVKEVKNATYKANIQIKSEKTSCKDSLNMTVFVVKKLQFLTIFKTELAPIKNYSLVKIIDVYKHTFLKLNIFRKQIEIKGYMLVILLSIIWVIISLEFWKKMRIFFKIPLFLVGLIVVHAIVYYFTFVF